MRQTTSPDKYSMRTRSTLKLNGKRRVALRGAYKLLACEEHDIGKVFIEDKKVMDLLTIRNYSILAHGLEPVNRDQYERFYDRVLYYARMLDKDIDSKIEDATFPQV